MWWCVCVCVVLPAPCPSRPPSLCAWLGGHAGPCFPCLSARVPPLPSSRLASLGSSSPLLRARCLLVAAVSALSGSVSLMVSLCAVSDHWLPWCREDHPGQPHPAGGPRSQDRGDRERGGTLLSALPSLPHSLLPSLPPSLPRSLPLSLSPSLSLFLHVITVRGVGVWACGVWLVW